MAEEEKEIVETETVYWYEIIPLDKSIICNMFSERYKTKKLGEAAIDTPFLKGNFRVVKVNIVIPKNAKKPIVEE